MGLRLEADDRLAARHHHIREQSLVKALARAIALVEMTDMDEAIRITAELEADFAPLVGAPIILRCAEMVPLVETIEEPVCIFGGAICVHRMPGGLA